MPSAPSAPGFPPSDPRPRLSTGKRSFVAKDYLDSIHESTSTERFREQHLSARKKTSFRNDRYEGRDHGTGIRGQGSGRLVGSGQWVENSRGAQELSPAETAVRFAHSLRSAREEMSASLLRDRSDPMNRGNPSPPPNNDSGFLCAPCVSAGGRGLIGVRPPREAGLASPVCRTISRRDAEFAKKTITAMQRGNRQTPDKGFGFPPLRLCGRRGCSSETLLPLRRRDRQENHVKGRTSPPPGLGVTQDPLMTVWISSAGQ